MGRPKKLVERMEEITYSPAENIIISAEVEKVKGAPYKVCNTPLGKKFSPAGPEPWEGTVAFGPDWTETFRARRCHIASVERTNNAVIVTMDDGLTLERTFSIPMRPDEDRLTYHERLSSLAGTGADPFVRATGLCRKIVFTSQDVEV